MSDRADSAEQIHEALKAAARESRVRLVALLASGTSDIHLAEDAVAVAFERALTQWFDSGVPANPEGWLLIVARNHQRDVWKSAAHRRTESLDHRVEDPEVSSDTGAPGLINTIEDRRLELLFVCAHPAIDRSIRTPLMLQIVLGFEAADIARACAIAPAAMSQRLVRAKRKIKEARIPFLLPDPAQYTERLGFVLEAVYGCCAIAWNEDPDLDLTESMSQEALFLARTITLILPDEPEAFGLAALIAFSLSRSEARTSEYVPITEQDPSVWDTTLIANAESDLRKALSFKRPGRFTLEAAMQAVHADRARTGLIDWPALRVLADALIIIAPTMGAQVARAAIILENDGAEAALDVLDELSTDPSTNPSTADFQPYHATRAEVLRRQGRHAESRDAYRRAIELAGDDKTRRWLEARAEAV